MIIYLKSSVLHMHAYAIKPKLQSGMQFYIVFHNQKFITKKI